MRGIKNDDNDQIGNAIYGLMKFGCSHLLLNKELTEKRLFEIVAQGKKLTDKELRLVLKSFLFLRDEEEEKRVA